jgi:O-antigen/teichoic acid export membrane protein
MRALPRRFRRNVATTYLTTVVSALQVLLVTPLLVRGLGPERYGIWSVVVSIGLFAILLDLGLASATIRNVAHYEALGQRDQVVNTVAASFWMLACFGALAILVGAVLAPLFPLVFDVHGEDTAASILVVLSATAIAIAIVGGAFRGCLGGYQRYTFLNATYIAAVVAQATAYAIVIWLGGGLVALGVVLVVVAFGEQFASYLAARHYVPELTLSLQNVTRAFAKDILKLSAWISSTHVATAVRYRLDTIVVGLVVGVVAAGIYAVGQLLYTAVDRFIRPTLTGFFPHSAELAGRRDSESLRTALLTGTRFSLAVAGMLALPTMLLAEPVLNTWVGPGYEEARFVIYYLVSAAFLATITRTGLLMLQGAGNVRVPAGIVWAEAVLNLVLSVVLGIAIGLSGVALATLIATALVSTLVGVPYICQEFGVSVRPFVVSIVRAHVPAIAAAVGVWLVVQPGADAGLVRIVVVGAVIMLAYALTLAFTGLNGHERRQVLGLLRRTRSSAVSET